MLRVAAKRGLGLAAQYAVQGTRNACTMSGCEGNSIAKLVNAVKASNSSTFASGGLASLKSTITPAYPKPCDKGWSLQYKAFLGAVAAWFYYRANTQARSQDWIVDLSLDVLQSAWLISFASFIPFRGVFMALRGLAPSGAAPLAALRPAVLLK